MMLLASCSGGSSGSNTLTNLINGGESTPTVIPASQVETQKLITAVQADPIYKIDDSEIEMLKTEGIITDQDQNQLKTIQ